MRKTDSLGFNLHLESKIQNKWINEQTKSRIRPINTENKLTFSGGVMGGQNGWGRVGDMASIYGMNKWRG